MAARPRHRESHRGPVPLLAANVTIGWAMSGSKRDRYSYEDTLAVPDLQVTNERLITYRLLDYGDVVAYDEIEGLLGRPTEGFLGVLFNLIGEGNVHWSRMIIAADGLQVSRARAGKGPFNVESSVTVFPDGRMEKDVPGSAGPQITRAEASSGAEGSLPALGPRTRPLGACCQLQLSRRQLVPERATKSNRPCKPRPIHAPKGCDDL